MKKISAPDCGKPITILVVDDNALYQQGLCDLIAHWEMFQIIGLAADGAEALELYRRHHPEIVLMDVCMPVMSGPEAVQRILQEAPDARIIMMTISGDDQNLLESIRSGACGYILKDATRQQLQHLLLGNAAVRAAGDRRTAHP